MKASQFIEMYGDFEISEEIKKSISNQSKSVWNLEEGDICFYLDPFNKIQETDWANAADMISLRSIGLVSTRESVLEFKRESMKIYEQLKCFSKKFTDDEWMDGNILKYFIYYNYKEKRLGYDITILSKTNQLYFESRKTAEEAVAAIGEEQVKKYYLGIISE